MQVGFLNHWQALIAALIGVLIDVDHPLEYAFIRKKFSLRKAWNNSTVLHRIKERSFIHHWRGLVIVTVFCLVILFLNKIVAVIIILGYYSHLLLDYVHVGLLEKTVKFRELGFSVRIPEYEIVLDAVLLAGIVLLLVF